MIVQGRADSDPLAACFGKEPFDSAERALKAARNQNKHRMKVKAYRCPHCGSYHLSHAGKN